MNKARIIKLAQQRVGKVLKYESVHLGVIGVPNTGGLAHYSWTGLPTSKAIEVAGVCIECGYL